MRLITGNEKMFGGLKICREVIDLINRSNTLVRQLLKYESDVNGGL